ncbi:MAG TPA: 4'-phosphopantetheinyl transferase superfamily protein [Thermoanaerobaculia bacterium]
MNDPRVIVLERSALDHGVFAEEELSVADGFKLQKRRDEWLLSRCAAKILTVRLGLAFDPRNVRIERPRIVVDGVELPLFVSLSHSAPFAAAAIDERPIGLDIQVVRPVDERAARLFLTPEEREVMERCTLPDRVLHFWAAKEAAWKQRSDEFPTLKALRLELSQEVEDGLQFDRVDTWRQGELIVAVTN